MFSFDLVRTFQGYDIKNPVRGCLSRTRVCDGVYRKSGLNPGQLGCPACYLDGCKYPLRPDFMRVSEDHGGVAERSKAPVLKTGDVNSVLGFESLPLRQIPPQKQ